MPNHNHPVKRVLKAALPVLVAYGAGHLDGRRYVVEKLKKRDLLIIRPERPSR